MASGRVPKMTRTVGLLMIFSFPFLLARSHTPEEFFERLHPKYNSRVGDFAISLRLREHPMLF